MRTYDDIAEWYDTWVGTHSILHPCFHTSQSGEMDTPEGAVPAILVAGCRKPKR